MKKRLLAAILLIACIFSLCSCPEDQPPANPNDPPSTDNGNTTPPDDNGGDNTGDPVPEITYLSNKELAAELSSSIWKTDKLLGNNKKFGLTAPADIGIDKEKFENEVLYPIPVESEFDKIYDVTEYGVSTENEDNSAAINAVIELTKAEEGLKYIYFPAGTYKLSSTVSLDGTKGVYFGGEDIHFVGTRWFPMFSINYAEDLHFNGFTIEFDPTPSVTAKVLYQDYDKVEFQVLEEFDMSNPIYRESMNSRRIALLEYKYDEISGRYVPNGKGNGCEGTVISYSGENVDIDAETNVLTLKNPGGLWKMEQGTVVNIRFTHNTYCAFSGGWAKNVYWEGVDIYSNPGMAFYMHTSSNFYLNDLNITYKPGTNQVLTTTSDGLHTPATTGEIVVTNSTFLGLLDDAFNVNAGQYHTVQGVSGKELIIPNTDFYAVGETIEIFSTKDLSSLGTYKIESIEQGESNRKLILDKEPPAEAAGQKLGNVSKTPKLTVKNCLIGNKRNRGMLLQCRDITIVNNTFLNIIHNGMIIHSVCDVYGEAIVPKSITIENNKFIGGHGHDIVIQSWGYETRSPGVITDVAIRNNFFANSYYGSMLISTAGDTSIENNMFYNICLGDIDSASYVAISITTSENMYVTGNLLYTDEKRAHLEILTRGDMYIEQKANFYLYGDK